MNTCKVVVPKAYSYCDRLAVDCVVAFECEIMSSPKASLYLSSTTSLP